MSENGHKLICGVHADAHMALGRYGEAAVQLEAVIGLYNDEGLWLRLLTAYQRNGAADAAESAFRRATKAFGRRLPRSLLAAHTVIARGDETAGDDLAPRPPLVTLPSHTQLRFAPNTNAGERDSSDAEAIRAFRAADRQVGGLICMRR